ncbi:helix-turn-helix domain-containing protein [Serratia sp. IR-2025]
MNTLQAVVRTFMDDERITKKELASRLGLSVWKLNAMLRDENLGIDSKELIADALNITLEDLIEVCRMCDEMKGDFKKGDNHG